MSLMTAGRHEVHGLAEPGRCGVRSGTAAPFLSVITVTLNDGPGLRRTWESLIRQSWTDFDWLVIDGGSQDGTLGFLSGITHPSLRWVSEPDHGIYDAMNKGTSMAHGRYLLYLNAGDDLVDADSLATVHQKIGDCGEPELLYGGANYRFADESIWYRAPRPIEKAIRHSVPGVHQATFFMRRVLDEPAYDLTYGISGDYFISARCYLKGARAGYLDRAICNFYIGGISTKRANRSLLECWRIQRDVLRMGRVARLQSAVRRFIAHRLIFGRHRFPRLGQFIDFLPRISRKFLDR